ncbi:hypothetical protein Q1695_015934 [Nippostrongylus brasiliensis]|nr:hypothetical protein Q1695_015934 [Nippostrongylus brasiliensis]
MGEHVSITMSVSVALIRAFLPLFFLISATAAEEKCSHLKGKVEIQWIPEYEKFHEGLGLKFDCAAMEKADASAVKLKAGDKNYLVGDEWCQYSRLVWDPLYADYLASQTVPMGTMPRDKINETAQLHPNTIYGCSARMYITRFSVRFSIACIYKKTADETRCTYS